MVIFKHVPLYAINMCKLLPKYSLFTIMKYYGFIPSNDPDVLESRVSLLMLAFINGILITIKDAKLAEKLAPTIEYGLSVCEKCINVFPETGNRDANMEWMLTKIHEADHILNNKESATFYSILVLTALAQNIVNDLAQRIHNESRLKLIEPLFEVISGLSDQLDPNGDQFQAYDEADEHLQQVYELMKGELEVLETLESLA